MATITTTQPASTSSLKRFISRHPVLAYFLLAFASGWIVWLPLVLSQSGIGLLPFSIEFTDAFNPLVGFVGLTLTGFIVAAVTEGKAGVRQLRRQILQWRVGVSWYLLVFLGIPIVFLLAGIIWRGVPPSNTIQQEWLGFFASYLPEVLLIGLLVNLWEEIGWMGFAMPRMQQRYGPLAASVFVGALFALFHLPLFFIGGVPALGTVLLYMPLTILIAIPQRIVMTWLFNNTKGSVIIAMLFHAAHNSANNHLLELFPGVDDPGRYVFLVITYIVVAAILLVWTKGRLSYRADDAAQPAGEPHAGGVSVVQA